MKTISTFFVVSLLTIFSKTTNAQNSEIASNNTLTGKENLSYSMIPEIRVWEKIAGLNEDASLEKENLNAKYDVNNQEITINGTDNGGNIEIWDVQGNTVFYKATANPSTIFTSGNLPSGSYYVNYSKDQFCESVKLNVR
jgi:hypothetical protein